MEIPFLLKNKIYVLVLNLIVNPLQFNDFYSSFCWVFFITVKLFHVLSRRLSTS